MYQVIIYGFPLILVAFESGLKFLMQYDNTSFAGPALSAAALSFLLPLTKPKILEIKIPEHPNAIVTTIGDRKLVGFVWILVFLYLFAWASVCYLSVQSPTLKIWLLDLAFVIGLTTYLISLILTFAKEKV
nr:hypothetical protein [Pseudomonas oleovorans]